MICDGFGSIPIISGIVWLTARNLDVLMLLGIPLNLSTMRGNDGTVKMTASITACKLEKRRGSKMEKTLLSIMENGHSRVSLGFRFFQNFTKIR